MNLLYFVLAALLIFSSTLICFEKKNIWNTIISSIGIAGVVNANFFHSGNYPIDIFGMQFGIDSIIYTFFVFTIILNYLYFGKKSAITYTISGASAVFLAGAIGVTAKAFHSGHSIEAWNEFGTFSVSTAATIAAGVAMIFLIDLLKKRTKINDMVVVIIGILIATFINSTIYYSIEPLLQNYKFDWIPILTSLLGKFIALLAACFAFGFMKLIERKIKKKELEKQKEETIKESE